MFKILYCTLLAALSSTFLHAQDVVFSIQVPSSKMGIDDAIQVRYELENVQSLEDFGLQNLNDFEVVGGPSQGQNFSMINGEVSMSVSITYAFKPKRKGVLKFPIGVAIVKGKKIKSNEASIEVLNGSLAVRQQRRNQSPFDEDPFDELLRLQRQMAQQRREWLQNQQRRQGAAGAPQQTPQAMPPQHGNKVTRANLDKNIFIRVDVDKTQALLGEQITASYKLYTRIPMQVNLTKLPDLNNFWAQDFELPTPPKPKREILDGVEYQVFTIKKSALFPTQTGVLSLDPAEGEGTARLIKEIKTKRRNPFGDFFDDDPFFNQAFGSLLMDDPFFNDGFFNTYEYDDVPVKLKSKPVSITVSAPPLADKPASYKGAIGQYKLESRIGRTEITTDDVATLTLTIRGSGNFKLITPPQILLPSSVELYDPIEFDTITSKKNNMISGYKEITYRFTPLAAGVLKVPPIEFSYYNPETQSYITASTPEYTLSVKPGKNPVSKGNKLPADIHDIADEKTELCTDRPYYLPNSKWYWGSYAISSLAFLTFVLLKRKREKEMGNIATYRTKRANKVALRRLELAEKHLRAGERTSFFEETAKAVWLYLSDKLSIPMANLSKEMTSSLLQQKGVGEALIDEVFLITDECELALYAPDSGELKMNQIYSDSLKLIGKLEEKLN